MTTDLPDGPEKAPHAADDRARRTLADRLKRLLADQRSLFLEQNKNRWFIESFQP